MPSVLDTFDANWDMFWESIGDSGAEGLENLFEFQSNFSVESDSSFGSGVLLFTEALLSLRIRFSLSVSLQYRLWIQLGCA